MSGKDVERRSRGVLASFRSSLGQLLGVIVGGTITLAGTWITLNAQADERREQADREDEQRAREAAVVAYAEFLDAADVYAVEVKQNWDCRVQGGDCPMGAVQQARHDFQRAINSVYIHGSNEGVRASQGVAGTLPPSLIGVTGEPTAVDVDEGAFVEAYQEMNRVFCEESNVDRTRSCDQ